MREYPRGVQTATERQPSTTIFMTRGIAPWLRQEATPDFENQPLSPPEAVPQGDGTSPSEGAEALTNIRTAPPITNVPSVSTGSSVEDSGSEIDALERTPIKALGSLWQIGYPYTDTEMSTLYEMPLWKVKLRPLAPAKISPSFPPNPFLPVTEPVLSPSMRYTPEQARPVTVPSPPHTLYPCSPRPVICPQLTQGYATDMHKPGKSDDHIPQLGKRQRDVESEEDWDEHKSTTGTLITESQRGTSNAEKAVASVVTDAQRAALLMRQFAKRRCLVREEEDGMGD
ncbi:hypothetical protein BS47DRAFT_432765 [Hydnum rufescens UP504]|uniref:Uncharacterized protein n=1 Tax=Hydnum rufescens UP504 TaxID=1448309 RepID=A0A9P6AIL7_9AGAM|nr:hypothetical protein BS47DRAFT_432765 [Hydnum rufescens UP504]